MSVSSEATTPERPTPRRPTPERPTPRSRSDGWALPGELTNAVRYIVNSYDVRGLGTVPKRIAVTASLRREGTTTVSQTLAVVLADDFEASVCWVDLAWMSPRRSRSSKKKGQPVRTPSGPGLAAHLAGEIGLDAAITVTNHPRIDLLRPGAMPDDQQRPSPRSPAFDRLMADLSQRYQFVVVDMPPLLGSSAALPLFRVVDAYAMVVRSGVTHLNQIKSAVTLLDEVEHLGTVLNHHSPKMPRFLRRLGDD